MLELLPKFLFKLIKEIVYIFCLNFFCKLFFVFTFIEDMLNRVSCDDLSKNLYIFQSKQRKDFNIFKE